MFETFLITTSSAGLQPLGSAAQRSFELITGTIGARLDQAHADLFAEPVATRHGDRIDWYAPMPGKAVPLPELDPGDQARVRTALGRKIAAIRDLADLLAGSDTADDQRLAEALANAIEIPSPAMVHVVRASDGTLHPVLVHWGWVADEQKMVRGVLTGMVPRPAAPGTAGSGDAAPPPGGRSRRRFFWLILLGWLLLAALLGTILYLLITPCGLDRDRLFFCPPDGPAIDAARAERRVIDDEIARLERELALMDRVCKPTIPLLVPQVAPEVVPEEEPETNPAPVPPAFPKPPVPQQEDQSQTEADRAEIDRRITKRGAARGALNFALAWASRDDIDLYVTCPAGQTISYRNRSACGGTYDLDANVTRRTAVDDPVENVVFNDVTPGIYRIRAQLRSARTEGPKTVTLHVLRRDGRSQSFSGTVGAGQNEWTMNISISR
jgi:hypothetical protein